MTKLTCMMGLTILLSGCAITHDGDALSIPADVQTNAEARARYLLLFIFFSSVAGGMLTPQSPL
jgi:hypothetical protein